MKDIKSFRKDIILLFIAELLWPLGLALYTGFFPLHIRELGGSDIIVGIIMSIPNILGILAILGGILCDITDRKYVIIFGWAITIPAPLIWAFANRWEWMLVGQIIYSLTWVCSPAITLYILDYKTAGNKMAGYTLVYLAGPLGSTIAPAIGGKIISSYGRQTLYLIVFALYSISTLCTLMLTKQPVEKNKDLRNSFSLKLDMNSSSVKKLASAVVFFTVLTAFQNIGESYLSLFMSEFRKASIDWIGFYYTALFIGASLFTALLGKSNERLNPHVSLTTGNILFVMSILFLVFPTNSVFVLILAFFLRGMNRSILVFNQAIFAQNTNNSNNKGFILSLFIAFRSIIIGLAVYPGAFLYRANPKYPFYAEAILVIIWILFSYSGRFKNYLRNN